MVRLFTLLWMLPFALCAVPPIKQLNSLDQALLPSSEAARVNLSDFFLGEDLTFAADSSFQVTQRASFLSSTRLPKAQSPNEHAIAMDSESATACILRSTQLQFWDVSDLHRPQLINSTELSASSSLSEVVMFTYAEEAYALVTGSSLFAAQAYLVRLDTSLTLLGTFQNNRGFAGLSVISTGNSIEAYLRTTNGQLLLVQFNPQPTVIATVTTSSYGFSNTYKLEFVEEQGVICDSSFGLATFDLAQLRSGTFAVTKSSKIPLAFGTTAGCVFTNATAVISTGSDLLTFSIPDLAFIQRLPSGQQGLKTLSVVNPYIFGYSTTSSIFSSTTSFVVINTAKPLVYMVEMIIPTRSLILSDTGGSQTPPYVVYEDDTGRITLLMAAATYLWSFEITKFPVLTPSFTPAPGTLTGTLTVSNSAQSLSAAYNFTIVEVADFKIVPWKGVSPSQEYPRYTSIPVVAPTFSDSLMFDLPLSNYFSGQNVKYSLKSLDQSDSVDLQLSIPPRDNIVKLHSLRPITSSNVKLTTYEGHGWVLLLVVPGNVNSVTLVDGLLINGSAKNVEVVCTDLKDIASAGHVTAVNDKPHVAVQCGNHWEVFSYSTGLNYEFAIADKGTLAAVTCEYLLVGDDTSVAVYDLKLGGKLVRTIDGESTGLYENFQVLQMTAGQFCGTVYIDSGEAGLLAVQVAFADYETLFVVQKGEIIQFFDGYLYLLKPGDAFNLAQIDLSSATPVVTNEFPALTKCSSLQLAGTYAQLYLLCKGQASTAVYVWNTREQAYEALYSVISAEPNSAIASVSADGGLLYIYGSSLVGVRQIGQGVDPSTSLVPSFDRRGTVWGILDVTLHKPIIDTLRVPFELQATSTTDAKSITLELVVGTRGAQVKQNPAFNVSSSELTGLRRISVENGPKNFSVPIDAFVGNGVEFYINVGGTIVHGVYDCSTTSAPACIEAKTAKLVNSTSTALDFTAIGNKVYAVNATGLTEIAYSEYPDWKVSHFSYSTIFTETGITCDMIEGDSESAKLVMRCFDSQGSAYLAVVNGQNLDVLNLQQQTVPPVLLSVASNPCAIYLYDKASVTQISCTTYNQVFKLSPEMLELSSFDVVSVLQFEPQQVLLALADELVLVDVDRTPTVLSRLTLVNSMNCSDSPRLQSAVATDSLILAVGSNSFVYKVKFNGTALVQVQEFPSLFDDSSWRTSLGLLPEKSLIAYPALQENNNVQLAFVNYSQTTDKCVYSYFSIGQTDLLPLGAPSKVIILPTAASDRYFVVALVRPSLTLPATLVFLGLNTQPSVSFRPTPDKVPETISLGGSNLVSSDQVGKLEVYFSDKRKSHHHHHHSSSEDVANKWWFWLILFGALMGFFAAVTYGLLRLRKKRLRARQGSEIQSSFISNTDL